MTKTSIVDDLAKNKVVETIIQNITKGSTMDTLKDLAQDIYIDLLQKEEKKLVKMYEKKELKYFITKMVTNNVFSSNSPYYMQYKRFQDKTTDIDEYQFDPQRNKEPSE